MPHGELLRWLGPVKRETSDEDAVRKVAVEVVVL
jgi:hypothetical protein